MKLQPIKYKNNYLCPDGRRFKYLCSAVNYMQDNNCIKPILFSEVKAILIESKKNRYVIFQDRLKLLAAVYYCMYYEEKEYLIKQINKVL